MRVVGDATDMEHYIDEGAGKDATVEEEGPEGNAINTDEEPGGDTTNMKYLELWIPTSVPKAPPAST